MPNYLAQSLKPILTSLVVIAGLHELEAIVSYAGSMGVKCEILIAPSLVFHPDYYRGMVCQLVRKKTRGGQVNIKPIQSTRHVSKNQIQFAEL